MYDNNPNTTNSLLISSLYGQLETVKHIINNANFELDINNQTDISLMNPLIAAAQNGHLDIVRYLLTSSDLKNKPNINSKDIDGWDSLIYACRYGHLEIVKYLLTSPDIKEHSNLYIQHKKYHNILILSTHFKHYNIVDFLIIDMKIKIDDKTFAWLNGKNKNKIVYEDILKLIQYRDLYQKLDNSIDSENINKKKITGIKI